MDLPVPFLPYASLREVARTFLAERHASGAIPIPIERIIEFEFDIDIVPIPNGRLTASLG